MVAYGEDFNRDEWAVIDRLEAAAFRRVAEKEKQRERRGEREMAGRLCGNCWRDADLMIGWNRQSIAICSMCLKTLRLAGYLVAFGEISKVGPEELQAAVRAAVGKVMDAGYQDLKAAVEPDAMRTSVWVRMKRLLGLSR